MWCSQVELLCSILWSSRVEPLCSFVWFEYVFAFWFWCHCCMVFVNSVYIYVMRWPCEMVCYLCISCVAFLSRTNVSVVWLYMCVIYGLRAFRIYEYIWPNDRYVCRGVRAGKRPDQPCEYDSVDEDNSYTRSPRTTAAGRVVTWSSWPLNLVFVTPQALVAFGPSWHSDGSALSLKAL